MSYSEKELVQEESKEIMSKNWAEIRPGVWARKISEEPIEESEVKSLKISFLEKLNIKFNLRKNKFKYLRWFFLTLGIWSVLMVFIKIYLGKFGFFFYLEIFNTINLYNFYWMNKAYREDLKMNGGFS